MTPFLVFLLEEPRYQHFGWLQVLHGRLNVFAQCHQAVCVPRGVAVYAGGIEDQSSWPHRIVVDLSLCRYMLQIQMLDRFPLP
jgi:hypothetical protein